MTTNDDNDDYGHEHKTEQALETHELIVTVSLGGFEPQTLVSVKTRHNQ